VADLVAAVFLGVVERLVGVAEDLHGRACRVLTKPTLTVTWPTCGKTWFSTAWRKRLKIWRAVSSVAERSRITNSSPPKRKMRSWARNDAQQIGHQDQHLVAVQMAEAVVDLLEVVDVHHRQPVLGLLSSSAVRRRSAWPGRVNSASKVLRLNRPVSASRSL
jgi:hypothetical protein